MDDTRARLPEADVVLGTRQAGEEVVDLLVDADGAGKILGATDLGLTSSGHSGRWRGSRRRACRPT